VALPESFVDEVRARVRLAEVVGRRVRLVRRGREHIGCCPFHNEKTPSFTINEAKGFYHCFGCGAHGSVFDFVMRMDDVGFPEAVARLAAEVGLTPPPSSPEAHAHAERDAALHDVLEAAAVYYEKMLRLPEGAAALGYLRRRSIGDDAIRRFRLGFAPDGRSALKAALMRAGFRDEAMIECGLLIAADDAGRPPYDRFRGRLMFPITDRRGRVVGFGGRILGQGQPKYLNSPETPLFHKGRLLYGLGLAAEAARSAGTLVVVEGYMDVIGLSQSGIGHVVAPLGTALTEEQVRQLWQMVPEPILWFDPDAAGQRAAVRSAEAALPLIRSGYGMKFAFSRIDTGDDPADLARRYEPRFVRQTLAEAVALSEMVFRVAREGCRLTGAEDRARIEDRLRRHVERIKDPAMRRHFRTQFRDRLWQELRRKPAARPAAAQAAPAADVPSRRVNAERELLALSMLHPELFDEIEEAFGSLPFADAGHDRLRQALIGLLSGRSDAPDPPTLRSMLEEGGLAAEVGAVVDHPTVRLAGARASAPDRDELRARWRAAVRFVEAAAVEAEVVDTRDAEPSAELWARRKPLIEASMGNDD
jgi:DNA primase